MAYSVDQLRKTREQKDAPADALAGVPLDAPYDTEDAIGFWNGHSFVSWNEWVLSKPVRVEKSPEQSANAIPSIPPKTSSTKSGHSKERKRYK